MRDRSLGLDERLLWAREWLRQTGQPWATCIVACSVAYRVIEEAPERVGEAQDLLGEAQVAVERIGPEGIRARWRLSLLMARVYLNLICPGGSPFKARNALVEMIAKGPGLLHLHPSQAVNVVRAHVIQAYLSLMHGHEDRAAGFAEAVGPLARSSITLYQRIGYHEAYEMRDLGLATVLGNVILSRLGRHPEIGSPPSFPFPVTGNYPPVFREALEGCERVSGGEGIFRYRG